MQFTQEGESIADGVELGIEVRRELAHRMESAVGVAKLQERVVEHDLLRLRPAVDIERRRPAEALGVEIHRQIERDMVDSSLERPGDQPDIPGVKLDKDAYSIKSSIPGNDKAYVRAETPSPGVIEVTDLYKGDLPKGGGSQLLAQTLRDHGALPTKELVFKGVINQATLEAYHAGIAAEDTPLGKSGARALEQLGLKAKNIRYETKRGKLNIVFDVE